MSRKLATIATKALRSVLTSASQPKKEVTSSKYPADRDTITDKTLPGAKNWLINLEKNFSHRELDFSIRFTPDWKSVAHSSNILQMYWPEQFNFQFSEPLSGTTSEFSEWAKQQGYLTDKEVAFGLDMHTNALFTPACPIDVKFLAHRYAFCFYLFDDLYEYLMSFENGRGLGDTFAHNFRAIVSGQNDVRPLDQFAHPLAKEVQRAKLVQATTANLISEARNILSKEVLHRWFEINYITYTTCVIESKLWRQKVAAGQFVTRREYADVKQFNSAFHSVLFTLLREPDLMYYPIDEPLTGETRNASARATCVLILGVILFLLQPFARSPCASTMISFRFRKNDACSSTRTTR